MADLTTQTFPITGMTCASCVRHVEKALATVPGVSAAHVDLAREQATVTHAGVDPTLLAQAVVAKGYGLVLNPADRDERGENRRAQIRVAIAWACAIPLLLPMIGVPLLIDWRIQAVLAAIAAFGCGGGFIIRAWRLAVQGEASMDTLVAIGMVAAFAAGLVDGLGGAHHTSFEIAASLPAFVLLGKFLEHQAKHRATSSLSALLELAPATALRLSDDGSEREVPVAELKPGDRVRVRPGAAIPVDGQVLSGRADVSEALLTGEPLPIAKAPGDAVIAGALVHGGSLDISVRAAGAGTWLARLADQVSAATASRAPAQILADRISAVFVPVVLILAAVTFAGWWIFSGEATLAWRPAVTLLVIACPCALGLATPVAMATALGTAARQGLLVRDSAALERLANATDLVLDKTGTLTEGRPLVQEVRLVADLDDAAIRRLAAALERDSEHPLARAIRAAWAGPLPEVSVWRSDPGGGVSGSCEGRKLRLGNEKFLGFPLGNLPADATAIGLADEQRLLALFLIADRQRPEAIEVLAALQANGLRLHLLSGDRSEAVQTFASAFPFASVAGGVSPTGKAERIAALQAEGRVVAFAGDGVNDALALAAADAGISLPGLDAAAASAPLNLRREGLLPLLAARRLARKLHANIRQNLAWAFGYNLVLMPLAAFGLLEQFGGIMLAGAAMGLSSLTVVLNALRLRRS